MLILEAAMSFAVAMIILSTLVTGIVEFIHRCLRTRKRYLVRTVRHLFDDIVRPRLEARAGILAERGGGVAGLREAFVRRLVQNPLSERFELAGGLELPGVVENLTPLEFAERLGRSEVGAAMLQAGEEQARRLLTDFARSFERYGRAASEQLHQRSRLTAVVVGVVFALGANIHAGRLMTAMLEDASLRDDMMAQVGAAHARNVAALDSLEAGMAEGGGAEDPEALRSLAGQVDALGVRFEEARALRLPVGHDWYPYCQAQSPEPACAGEVDPWSPQFLRWVLMCVLAGVLIGLGGPFWFRVFTSLSRVVDLLRGLGRGGGKPAQPATEAGKQRPEESERPASLVDAFLVAAGAHEAAVAAGRSP